MDAEVQEGRFQKDGSGSRALLGVLGFRVWISSPYNGESKVENEMQL